MWGHAPTEPIITKFGARDLVGDVIIGDKFCRDRLRGFRSVGVRKLGLPLTWAVALTTGQQLDADYDYDFTAELIGTGDRSETMGVILKIIIKVVCSFQ